MIMIITITIITTIQVEGPKPNGTCASVCPKS